MPCADPPKITTEDGEVFMGQCRKCEYCLQQRRMFWIGRILAEQQTAEQMLFCTFTYGGGYENEDAYWIDPNDLVKCLKRMRYGSKKKNQPPLRFRYISVGEYGSLGNRGHFHAILFLEDELPNIELDKRVDDYFAWPHGYVQFEPPRSAKASGVYIMDYLDKDALKENLMSYSNRPPLGTKYLLDYAESHARNGMGLFQSGNNYTVPGSVRRNGQPFRYKIKRNSKIYDQMVELYIQKWIELRPEQVIPINSEMEEIIEDILLNRWYLPDGWTEYFEKHYEDFETRPEKAWTSSASFANLSIGVYPKGYGIIEAYNNYGEIIWYCGFAKDELDQLAPNQIDPPARIEWLVNNERRAVQWALNKAPSWVVKFIEQERSKKLKPS